MRAAVGAVVAALFALGSGQAAPAAEEGGAAAAPRAPQVRTTANEFQRGLRGDGLSVWRKLAPQVSVVRVRSSLDGKGQRALFYDSGSPAKKPLIVVLHSWGGSYKQTLDIPFAEHAIANDWAFLHPDFRGPNVRPEATASPLAVQDVIDAVAYARGRAAIDDSRIYLVGYSGGGMKALVLAARHPELWAGVVAWCPIFDIPTWYREPSKPWHYAGQIAASCGGAPRPGSRAEADCRGRSPSSGLEAAAGRVPVFIAHGLGDTTVPPRHAMDAFNALAAPDARFTDEERAFVTTHGRLPEPLAKSSADLKLPPFDRAGLPARLQRTSRDATIVLYDGGHDMAYEPTLSWLEQRRRPARQEGLEVAPGAAGGEARAAP